MAVESSSFPAKLTSCRRVCALSIWLFTVNGSYRSPDVDVTPRRRGEESEEKLRHAAYQGGTESMLVANDYRSYSSRTNMRRRMLDADRNPIDTVGMRG